MTELIITIISAFSVLLVSIIAYCIVSYKHHNLDLDEWQDRYNTLHDKWAASQEDYVALLEKYSSSIDKHAAAYDDILNRCKKLELEIDAKDLEIDRLSTILNCIKESTNEKEEVKEGN